MSVKRSETAPAKGVIVHALDANGGTAVTTKSLTSEKMEARVARFNKLQTYQCQNFETHGIPAGAVEKITARRVYPVMAPADYQGRSAGAPSPGIWRKTIFGGKWGCLFWATSLEKFRRSDDACGGERAADPLHCSGIDPELFGNDTHTGSLGAARAYPNSLRHLHSSLARRYHPADSNCVEFDRSIFWTS